MKTIGLIGGITWQSTVEYYRIINEETRRLLGGSHSAKILMYSFDWNEVDTLRNSGNFDHVGDRFLEEARKLEKAGAGLLLLCANTAHRWSARIGAGISIPLIHIGDATGAEIQRQGLKNVLLLGTKYTMQERYISDVLEKKYLANVVVPGEEQIREVSRIIFDELAEGKFLNPSKKYLINLIRSIPGIDGVVLGCTELPLVIKPEDTPLCLIDTTYLHARAAVTFANRK